jgi:hypothetical protein
MFTPERCAEYALKYFNHIHTTASKAIVGAFSTCRDAVFLKRKFIKVDGVIMCPMSKQDIINSLMYIDSSSDLGVEEQTITNIHSALREFFFHGREEFNCQKSLLNPFLASINSKAIFTQSYDDLLSVYLKVIQKC